MVQSNVAADRNVEAFAQQVLGQASRTRRRDGELPGGMGASAIIDAENATAKAGTTCRKARR